MKFLLKKEGGAKYPLDKVLTIGSDPQNDIAIEGIDPAYAVVVARATGPELKVLSKSSGLKINGTESRGGKISRNDFISIHDHHFVVELMEDTAEGPADFLATRFDLLMDNLEQIAGNNDMASVSDNLLRSAVDLLDCDGGYLVAINEGKAQKVISCWPEKSPREYSKSVVEQAIAESRPIQWFEGAEETLPTRSMVSQNIKAALSNVLRNAEGEIEGVLYLHRRNRPGKAFSKADLHVFERLCRIFGLIVGEAQLVERQKEKIKELSEIKHEGIIFSCGKMQNVMEMVRKSAPSDIPVLLLGETGTGKEIMARELHALSNKKSGPFVAVNCGAIPKELIESELFGHVKGAFTGAVMDKKGVFEQAHNGTLFLDEIGELPMSMQVSLLRVLQEQCIIRVGGEKSIKTDARVICATNKNLTEEVSNGRFRQDLFYRINVFAIEIPPLRERERDVILLAKYLAGRYAKQLGAAEPRMTPALEKSLLAWPWKGNVRELENKIHRAVLTADSRGLTASAMGIESAESQRSLKQIKEEAELEAIESALAKSKGNLTQAAKFLDIDRKVLRDIMNRLNIKKDKYIA